MPHERRRQLTGRHSCRHQLHNYEARSSSVVDIVMVPSGSNNSALTITKMTHQHAFKPSSAPSRLRPKRESIIDTVHVQFLAALLDPEKILENSCFPPAANSAHFDEDSLVEREDVLCA